MMLRLTPHTKHPTSMDQATTPQVLLVGVRGVDLSLPAEISLVGSIDSSSSKAMATVAENMMLVVTIHRSYCVSAV